jgi:non-specific serine/threonine protein kinase
VVSIYNSNYLAFPFHSKDDHTLLKDIININVEYPKYLSKSLVDLLKNIFVLNPKQRFTIEQIKQHLWFSEYEVNLKLEILSQL